MVWFVDVFVRQTQCSIVEKCRGFVVDVSQQVAYSTDVVFLDSTIDGYRSDASLWVSMFEYLKMDPAGAVFAYSRKRGTREFDVLVGFPGKHKRASRELSVPSRRCVYRRRICWSISCKRGSSPNSKDCTPLCFDCQCWRQKCTRTCSSQRTRVLVRAPTRCR